MDFLHKDMSGVSLQLDVLHEIGIENPRNKEQVKKNRSFSTLRSAIFLKLVWLSKVLRAQTHEYKQFCPLEVNLG
jgi:hypothetical protein